jgi:hypothetical protein
MSTPIRHVKYACQEGSLFNHHRHLVSYARKVKVHSLDQQFAQIAQLEPILKVDSPPALIALMEDFKETMLLRFVTCVPMGHSIRSLEWLPISSALNALLGDSAIQL